jgi:DNA-binding MarR family transcriptional regulator
MSENNDELLEVAKEIRDILLRIFVCYEEQYTEIQRKKAAEKLKALKAVLTTSERKKIYYLLFDPRNLSQTDIAKEVKVSQPAVSQCVNALLGQDLIEQAKSENGKVVYKDKYNLAKLL